MACNNNINVTLTFDDRPQIKGWTSFFSYIPDMMCGMNNKFFSFKQGDLYEHHKGKRNEFYDVYTPSTITVVFNEMPSDDKIFKTLFLESNQTWRADLKTNYTKSTIYDEEYFKRESRWFAYTRRDEQDTDFSSTAVIGVGNLLSNQGNNYAFAFVDSIVSIGDKLFQIVNNKDELLGEVVDVQGETIILNTADQSMLPIINAFCFVKKDSRIESSSMRGYYMECKLTNDQEEHVEIFAANTRIAKSYV